MKSITAFVLAAMALLVASAPTPKQESMLNNEEQDFLRDKRSQYGVQYLSPCAAAAASAPMPAHAPYHIDVAPMHGGYVIPHYGYAGPHYRSIDPAEAEQELLGFSDMDHVMSEHLPMARYGTYAAPSNTGGALGPMTKPANSNPTSAIGVFPNGNTEGCSVPLLLSCTPSIVRGQLVKTQPNDSAGSYRAADDRRLEGHINHIESGSQEHNIGAIHDPSHPSFHQ